MANIKKFFLNEKNQKALDKLIIHIKARVSKNQDTIDSYISSISKFLSEINKDYDKITVNDYEKWVSKIKDTSAEIYKSKIKRFYKYHKIKKLYKNIIINPKILSKKTKGKESVLTKEEINKFINAGEDIYEKALAELLLTTGGRSKQINLLNWGDITIEDVTIWVNITKIKEDTNDEEPIPIVAMDKPNCIYPKNLVNFYNTHIYLNKPEKPLFYSRSNKSEYKGKRLTKGSIYGIIKKIHKRSKIKKNITPHIFRHTSATYDGYWLNEHELNQKYGWKAGTKMANRYCKNSSQLLEDHYKKEAGVTKETIEQLSICPRCQEKNNINSKSCQKCNYPLGKNLAEKFEQTELENIRLTKENNKTYKINRQHQKDIKLLNKRINYQIKIQKRYFKIFYQYFLNKEFQTDINTIKKLMPLSKSNPKKFNELRQKEFDKWVKSDKPDKQLKKLDDIINKIDKKIN